MKRGTDWPMTIMPWCNGMFANYTSNAPAWSLASFSCTYVVVGGPPITVTSTLDWMAHYDYDLAAMTLVWTSPRKTFGGRDFFWILTQTPTNYPNDCYFQFRLYDFLTLDYVEANNSGVPTDGPWNGAFVDPKNMTQNPFHIPIFWLALTWGGVYPANYAVVNSPVAISNDCRPGAYV